MTEYISIDCDENEREDFLKRYNELIMEPYEHINQISRKDVKKKLCYVFNYWFGVPDDEMEIVTNIIDKLHNASLLMDDIQDNSDLRRSKPTAHKIYGYGRTIACIIKVVNNSLDEVPKIYTTKAINALSIAKIIAVKGQTMDTYWRDNFICPTEEEYIDAAIKKTGSLFKLIVELLKIFSGNESIDLEPFCNILAIYFHILGDFYNLKSKAYQEKKGFCEDITEGTFSFPIIHAVANNSNDGRIKEILKMKTNNDEIKQECLELIELYGGIEYTKKTLLSLHKQLNDEIERLGGHPNKEDIFMTLSGSKNDGTLFDFI